MAWALALEILDLWVDTFLLLTDAELWFVGLDHFLCFGSGFDRDDPAGRLAYS